MVRTGLGNTYSGRLIARGNVRRTLANTSNWLQMHLKRVSQNSRHSGAERDTELSAMECRY